MGDPVGIFSSLKMKDIHVDSRKPDVPLGPDGRRISQNMSTSQKALIGVVGGGGLLALGAAGYATLIQPDIIKQQEDLNNYGGARRWSLLGE